MEVCEDCITTSLEPVTWSTQSLSLWINLVGRDFCAKLQFAVQCVAVNCLTSPNHTTEVYGHG